MSFERDYSNSVWIGRNCFKRTRYSIRELQRDPVIYCSFADNVCLGQFKSIERARKAIVVHGQKASFQRLELTLQREKVRLGIVETVHFL